MRIEVGIQNTSSTRQRVGSRAVAEIPTRGRVLAKGHCHRSLGQRPRFVLDARKQWLKATVTRSRGRLFLAFSQSIRRMLQYHLGRCPRLRCFWPSANRSRTRIRSVALLRLVAFCLAILLPSGVTLVGIASADEITVTPEELRLLKQAERERAETIEGVYGAVVSIFGEVKNGKKEGGGSGVLFDEAGFALTNHHVVAAAGPKGKAGLSDGKLYDWKLIGTDPAGDVAVIRLLGKDKWPVAPLGDSSLVRVGDYAMAMGNPFVLAEDYQPTVTMGIVSGVERYQGGGMVYGNCIQVDSAINPGNSGGPLMNMRGEVIGINGRAAFAERGRVNVGVGFAISIQQIKNFLPDLLAAKVAQHGTLDAQFGMRDGKVVCEAINLDGRAARAGLALGDRLLSFNGAKIETANQLANIISMLPANWPAKVAYEHKGKEFEFAIRLSALTSYEPQVQVTPPPEPAPDQEDGEDQENSDSEKDSEERDDEEDEEGEGENGKPKPRAKRRRRRPKLPKLIPGKILSEEENTQAAIRLLSRWQESVRDTAVSGAVDGAKFQVEADGEFRIDLPDGVLVRDQSGFQEESDNGDRAEADLDTALGNDTVLAVLGMSAQADRSLVQLLGEPTVDGGDQVNGEPVFRLRFAKETNDPLYLWLTNEPQPKLVQLGFDRNGSLARSLLMLEDITKHGSLAVPARFQRVVGVSKTIKATLNVEIANRDAEVGTAPIEVHPELSRGFATATKYAQSRVVKIYGAKVGQTPGYCSGLLVGDSGEILTANGTQLNGTRTRVVLADGTSHIASTIRRSRSKQLALLKIEMETPQFFDLQSNANGFKCQQVLAISNLFKIAGRTDPSSVMLGVVSLQTKLEAKRGNRPFPYEGDVLLLDCISSNPGAPGGAVVDAKSGKLVGMIGPNSESRSSGTKLNYAIPVNVLRSFTLGQQPNEVARAVVHENSAKPFLGIRLFRIGGKKSPAYVDRVQRNSPAAKARLRPDDVVLGMGDERIRTIEDYDSVFEKLVPGQRVELAIKRGAKLMTIPLEVGGKR